MTRAGKFLVMFPNPLASGSWGTWLGFQVEDNVKEHYETCKPLLRLFKNIALILL